jgi:hypothetical protein
LAFAPHGGPSDSKRTRAALISVFGVVIIDLIGLAS